MRGGRLEYTISFGTRTVIETAPRAMRVGGANLGRDIELGEVQRQRGRESFPWRGVHAGATNHCETAIIQVRQLRGGLRYTLEVRCFNDGAAWRCLIPGGGERRVAR
jgi:alpha-glucosidase